MRVRTCAADGEIPTEHLPDWVKNDGEELEDAGGIDDSRGADESGGTSAKPASWVQRLRRYPNAARE